MNEVYSSVFCGEPHGKWKKYSIDQARVGRKCMRVVFHMSTKKNCGWKSTAKLFLCPTESISLQVLFIYLKIDK